MMLRRLLRDRRATTTVELALVGTALISLVFGILDTGLLFWTKGALESVASVTARCGATGYTWGTTTCTTGDTTKTYAVNAATNWLFSGVIATTNVTTTSAATTCNGVSGKFFVVTISCPYFASLPPPFSSQTVSVSACYPMP